MDMRRAAFTVTADGSYAARLALDGGTGGWFPERWTLDGPEPYAVPLPGTQPEEPDSDVLPLSDGRVLIRRKVAERHTVSLLYPTGPGTGELQVGAVECERLSLLPPAPGGTAAYGLVHHERSTALWLLHGGAFGPERIAEVGGRCSGGAWLDRTGRLLALDRELDGRTKTVIVDLGRGGVISPLLQITEESQDRLLLADPYSGLLLVRSDAPGHDRLGWGVLGSARPVRFPECLRLPNAVLTPFAAQPGQELAPEGCAVAFRIEGPTGSWVGVWRPAARRLQQFPAPAGWLVGTGLWTAGGELRLPYVTPYVRCGLARLRLPDTDRDRARGEDRDTPRGPTAAPTPPPAAERPRVPNPPPQDPTRPGLSPTDQARVPNPMPPLGEPAPPADRARVPNPMPDRPEGPAPAAPSSSDRGPHPAGPSARHIAPDAIRTPAPAGDPASPTTSAPRRLPPDPTPLGAPMPLNPPATDRAPTPPDPQGPQTPLRIPGNDPASPTTSAPRHLPPDPTPPRAPAPLNPPATDRAHVPNTTSPTRPPDPQGPQTPLRMPGNGNAPASPATPAPRPLPPDPTPLRAPTPLSPPATDQAPTPPDPQGQPAPFQSPAGPSAPVPPVSPDPMNQLGAPAPGQARPVSPAPAPRPLLLDPDPDPLGQPEPDVSGRSRSMPAEPTGPSASTAVGQPAQSDPVRPPAAGPAGPFASANSQGTRPDPLSAPVPHPADPVRASASTPSGQSEFNAPGARPPAPEAGRIVGTYPGVPAARSVLRDLTEPSPGPAPARRPLAAPDPVRAAACDTAAQGLTPVPPQALAPVPVQGPVLGPPPQRVEPDLWTAVPPSTYPGRPPAAMPEAWSAAARPAPAARGYECPSRPVPLQQAPLGRNPHP
ncbi:hypothetical protein ACH4UT_08780 [Streptomyces sp. NPDC020799]|uniref:hypothetical protein n=1 Tax=Streptomyces sp. NPDC020799 TaxID=3365091 RepID=UPI0037881B2C